MIQIIQQTLYLLIFIFLAIWPLKYIINEMSNRSWILTWSGIFVFIYVILGIVIATSFFWVFPAYKNVWIQLWLCLAFFTILPICMLKYLSKNILFNKIAPYLFSGLCFILFFGRGLMLDEVANLSSIFLTLYAIYHIDFFSLLLFAIMFFPLVIKKLKNLKLRRMYDSFIFVFALIVIIDYIISIQTGFITQYNFISFNHLFISIPIYLLIIFTIYYGAKKILISNVVYGSLNIIWIIPFIFILFFIDSLLLKFNMPELNWEYLVGTQNVLSIFFTYFASIPNAVNIVIWTFYEGDTVNFELILPTISMILTAFFTLGLIYITTLCIAVLQKIYPRNYAFKTI